MSLESFDELSRAFTEFVGSAPPYFDFPLGGNHRIFLPTELQLHRCINRSKNLTFEEIRAIASFNGVNAGYIAAIFAVRSAVHAARRGRPRWLTQGLFGLSGAANQVDMRDLYRALSIIENCARRISLDFHATMNSKRFMESETRTQAVIRNFMSWSPRDRSIDAMGFVEVQTADGLSFVNSI